MRKTNTTDYGPEPFVVEIGQAVLHNPNFRTALWTGKHFQVTLMHIPAGGELGLEINPGVDQLLRIEAGNGLVMMGRRQNLLNYQSRVSAGYAIIVPAGTWRNVVNTGKEPVTLFSVCAPPRTHGLCAGQKQTRMQMRRNWPQGRCAYKSF